MDQAPLPGTMSKKNVDIEAAAEVYQKHRDARLKQLEKEVEAKTALIRAMKKADRKIYKRGPYQVILTHIDKDDVKVQVTNAKEEED